MANENNEIILYRPDSTVSLEVRVEDETVWLSQKQIAQLFGTKPQAITRHLKNIYSSGELDKESTCSKMEQVQIEGSRTIRRNIEIYNLDAILSVGYRVNSRNASLFRSWATRILRDYLMKGYAVNQRFERLEYRMAKTEEQLDLIVRTSIPPSEGIFFNGEIFDAYTWLTDRIGKGQKRIIVIDPYADLTILQQLTRRKENVECCVYTSAKNKLINLDIKKFNSQYPKIMLNKNYSGHDRFLIIDDTIYHVGGSMKDVGNRLMAYSVLHSITVEELLFKIDFRKE